MSFMSVFEFRKSFRCRLPLFLVLLLASLASQGASLQTFMPQGRVDQQTRVTARFDADMVALGESHAAAPFETDCGKAGGSGRWLDARVWSWQLERPLKPGERCLFTRRAGLLAWDGSTVGGQARFEIFAGGFWPRQVRPPQGNFVDSEQIFALDAGAAVDAASLPGHLWCEAEGMGQRVAVQPVDGADAQTVLAHLRMRGPAPLLVRCAERLPPGARMKLVWGKGIRSADGAAVSDREESLNYTVQKPLRATVSCERERADAPCSPLSPVRIEFPADIPLKSLLAIRLRVPAADGRTELRAPADPNRGSSHRSDSATSIQFPAPFPQNATLQVEIPGNLRDMGGRALLNAASFPLRLPTGALPPLAKFPGRFGIVELKAGGLLPLTLRHVEASLATSQLHLAAASSLSSQRLTEDAEVIATLRALAAFERQTREVKWQREGRTEEYEDVHYARELSFLAGRTGVQRTSLPKPGGQKEFEVIGIPLGKPGYHVVEIESRLLGAALLARPAPMYVRSSALLTNLAVHLKRGHDNALVWVTALDSGQPVAGAEVRVSTCNGRELWRGKTDAAGRALVPQALDAEDCRPLPSSPKNARGETLDDAGDNWLFASARLGEDFSFVRSDWNEGIEPWRFGVETWGELARLKIHTVLDRSLFRPGQTVSMKHLARRRDSRGFAFPALDRLPKQLVVRHIDSNTEYPLPLNWDARGSALSQWRIPEAARRGNYEVSFSGGEEGMQVGAEFRVGDFRLPLYTGSVQGVPPRQIAPQRVPLALSLSFLNGGAVRAADVTVSATLRPRWPAYPHFEDFTFHIDFNEEALKAFGIESNREQERLVLDKQPVKLDAAGAGKLDVSLPARPRGPSELYSEMSFADPNGEIQTLRGTVELWPAAVALGVQVRDWAARNGKENVLEIVTLDTQGRPLPGQEITVRAKRRIDYSHRRRIVGGFYTYENSHEFIDLGVLCQGRSDSRGRLDCTPQTREPGEVLLLAETRDAQGNLARASTSYWVSGQGDSWFAAGNQDRFDVIPERRAYKPGETARLQVRTPFRSATALVTIEAGGIIESFVQPLSRFDPVIALPVKAEWGPNVYISVLAVRGRVEPLKWYSFFQWGWREPLAWFRDWWQPPQPTAMVDLAKPAYRIGLAEITVGHEAFRLNVEVMPEKTDYRPREEATVRLRVTTTEGRPVPAGSEVAFAAVDQALLELKPNESWNLLEAMMQKRGHEVETATAQSQVIGKRHFGRKAVPPGGGGGRAPARELFEPLLLWQPRVLLDADGRATLKVPINDALSEFRLVGVATAGSGLFGSGSATVRSRQELQLVSGLPPVVREGDRYRALMTIRNGTARAMQVRVSARAGTQSLAAQSVSLPAESAREIAWDALVPTVSPVVDWEFSAAEIGDGKAAALGDRLKIRQQVLPAVPVTVQQATRLPLAAGQPQALPVTLPPGALPGRGGIEIGLSAQISAPPPGLRRYFENYPHGCLEQKASVAIGLHDAKRWQAVADSLPALLDEEGLARYFPGEGPGSATLTAYLLDLAHLAGLSLPAESRNRMLKGLMDFAEARVRTREWAPAGVDALTIRKLAALEAITRQWPQAHTAARRVAAALELVPQRLPTVALIDAFLVAKRLPDLPQRAARLEAFQRELRNRLVYSGGRLGFSNEASDHGGWMMVSGDVNAFRLIEAVLDEPGWREELPRLLQGVQARQVHGHWQTTTANAWATVVLGLYARQFERAPVTGLTQAHWGAGKAELRWADVASATKTATAASPTPPVLFLPWSTPAAASSPQTLTLKHEGTGTPWASLQVLAAIPAPAGGSRAAGYRLQRTLTPLHGRNDKVLRRGDLWRVTLDIEADQDMNWVVLSDPVPAGARILGDGLGRDSSIAERVRRDEPLQAGQIAPRHIERSFEAFRAYYDYLPRGRSRIDYTVRLNNAGTFSLPPTRIEAMYAPELFGEQANAAVVVGE